MPESVQRSMRCPETTPGINRLNSSWSLDLQGLDPSGDNRSRTIVLIPARLAATRLPNKPLAMIGDAPMIVQVWRRAIEADVGRVAVACGDKAIAEAVCTAGGEAVLTDPNLPSGTDRIFAALNELDPDGRFERIVNLQGDFPTLDPAAVQQSLVPLDLLGVDIGTLVNPMDDPEERADSAKVKAVVSWHDDQIGRALYFTRAEAPWGTGPLFHHSGIYAFSRAALTRFAGLAPSPLEQREKLEQLRALEHGMTIGVAKIASAPFGVDTPSDLARARSLLSATYENKTEIS